MEISTSSGYLRLKFDAPRLRIRECIALAAACQTKGSVSRVVIWRTLAVILVAHDLPLAYPIYKTSPEPALRALIDELEPDVARLLSSYNITVQDTLVRLWNACPNPTRYLSLCAKCSSIDTPFDSL